MFLLKNEFRAAALLWAPAVLFSASVAPPTADEVYAAIRNGQAAKLQSWIAAGWQVSSADERGNTPLIHASAVGNADMVRMLIGAGADPKMANTRAPPAAAAETMREPGSYFESGFPHGGDQWISSMGTASMQ